MDFDALQYPYPSRRNVIFASHGMVATSQPLAAQAGLRVLQQGGNAIDAAVATAAVLTVVEPTSNGIGSDAFAQVWFQGKLYGLNASGPAPRSLSASVVRAAGGTSMPAYGWLPVTVPGAPAAWAALSKRFGQLPFEKLFESAVLYANEGYPVSPELGRNWASAFRTYQRVLQGARYAPWFDTFAPGGHPPAVGQIWRSTDHAKTLISIAESKSEAFYRGELAERIDAFSRATGGLLRFDDLAAYEPEWVEPLSVRFRDYHVWELPPNGQGLVALIALGILDGFEAASTPTIESVHQAIEAIKLAFVDGHHWIADPRFRDVPIQQLLSADHLEALRRQIGTQAQLPESNIAVSGGTVYLATADAAGNMVSYIQSNYQGFGSGIVIPHTGIALQDRGETFSLDSKAANVVEGGKRPYHTIIPGFLTFHGEPVGPFGVMGGFMQPQGHVQILLRCIDEAANPQAALDAPRWQWIDSNRVAFEHSYPTHLVEALARRGHQAEIPLLSTAFGRGQIIWRDPRSGVLTGATEPRTDGCVAAW